jgi:hypothetical protein
MGWEPVGDRRVKGGSKSGEMVKVFYINMKIK